MRVLLALDGSPASDAARRLVASLPWPEASIIHVVGAAEPEFSSIAEVPGYAAVAAEASPELQRSLAGILDAASRTLEAPGRIVRRSVHVGRAASVIVDEAAAMRAEMIVVGSRGLGPMRSMVLGSVSAEVVDHAPCPVLVVRRPKVESILYGTDGSASARGALTFLAGVRCFGDLPVEVICVGQRSTTFGALDFSVAPDAAPGFSGSGLVDREHVEEKAASAVEVLRAAGHPARWSVAAGNAAHEIVEAADGFGSDLIVLGSRGNTGLNRLLLGSVARNVLLHTDASVLIVREPLREERPEVVRGRVPVTAGAV